MLTKDEIRNRMTVIKDSGITLIELIIVISIIGILAVALGFEFNGWMGGYRVESQTKVMYVDLMNARARAMQRNRVHFADFPTATTYRISKDLNENGAIDAGEPLPTFPKTVEYTINGAIVITFDQRGLVYTGAPPVLIDPATPKTMSLTSTVTPDYNCIELAATRINIGQMSGGNCVA